MDTSDLTAAAPIRMHDLPPIRRVDDQLWQQLAPILVLEQPRKKRGRPRSDDRRIVDGLLWLAYTGAEWADLPAEFGSKSTCNKRLQEWIARGIFAEVWALLAATYADLAELNWSWLVPDGETSAAPGEKKGLWRSGSARTCSKRPHYPSSIACCTSLAVGRSWPLHNQAPRQFIRESL